MNKVKETDVNRSTDLVLQEVWAAKETLSASYGHDVSRLFAEARSRQKLSGHRIVSFQYPAKARRRKANTD